MGCHAPDQEWLLPRVLSLLEAPADLSCLAACARWSWGARAPGGGGSGSRAPAPPRAAPPASLLLVPHLAVPAGATLEAVLGWALRRVAPASLLSLRVDQAGANEVASRGARSASGARGAPGARARERLLDLCAAEGRPEWLAWLLRADLCLELFPHGADAADADDADAPPPRRALPAPAARRLDLGLLLRAGRGGEAPRPLGGQDAFPALRSAASAGHVEVLELLMRARANVLQVDENECSALHWAADRGHELACAALLGGRAHVDARDDDEWTPLCLAAEEGHVGVCRTLLGARAGVNLADEDLRSPLWWAVFKRHHSLVPLLLEHGADRAQGDQNGITPHALSESALSGPLLERAAPRLGAPSSSSSSDGGGS